MFKSVNVKFRNSTRSHNVAFIALIVFVISLPFTGIEWDLFRISRFEIKITMFTFSFLLITWLWRSFKYPGKRGIKEKLFYTFAFAYGITQFTSLINSPMPLESIKQGIIVASLLIMMVIISETILTKKMITPVLTSIGALSLAIGIIAVTNYYLFTDHTARLGQHNALGVIDLRGDTFYFGDILLYSIGAVIFVIANLSGKRYWKWIRWLLLLGWFSAIILTFTKGLIIAVIGFFILLFFILKGKRSFIAVCAGVFIIAAAINIAVIPKVSGRLFWAVPESEQIATIPEAEKALPLLLARLSVQDVRGSNSLSIRKKAIYISSINSIRPIKYFWFGHGAGLSQVLLPKLANDYDESIDEAIRETLKRRAVYGKDANLSLIDAHNLFLTEFFNTGIISVFFLLALIIFVIINGIKAIKISYGKSDGINELLFTTLIAMLAYRITGSLIVIPFFWFMLGLCFGISKLYVDPTKENEVK